MFRSNRKRKTIHAHVYTAKLVSFAVLVVVVIIAWTVVYCRCQTLGGDIKKLESQNTELLRSLKAEELKWARAKSPENLKRALSKHGLVMELPDISQVKRIPRKDMFRTSVADVDGAESMGFASANTRNNVNE